MSEGKPLDLEFKTILEIIRNPIAGDYTKAYAIEKYIKQQINETIKHLLDEIEKLPTETIFGKVGKTKDGIAIAPFVYVKKESIIKLIKKYFLEEVIEKA